MLLKRYPAFDIPALVCAKMDVWTCYFICCFLEKSLTTFYSLVFLRKTIE